MAKQTGLGEQELLVLRYVTDHAPISVREVAETFGAPRGLARTTILTVMERLRKKGHLTRRRASATPSPQGRSGERSSSVFEYLPAVSKQDLMQGLVQDFVEKTLGGSLSPFVAYLSDNKGLTDTELADLQRMVSKLNLHADAASKE